MARLTCNVYVLTEEGSTQLLEAGSTPPEWALAQLGEHTLEGTGEKSEAEPEGSAADESDGESDDEIPPAKGPGSSAKAWAAYALSKGFAVDENAKASEIREALEAEGIPTE